MSMIELQHLTPSVYYEQSRDFQFIGRLFDIVLNSVKMNADMLYNLPLGDNSDSKLVDLMALTLGLKLKHKYPANQLTAICSCFSDILRNKGSLYAAELTVNALLNAEGLKHEYRCSVSDDNTTLNIYVPRQLSDITLLRDILDYILPAGMKCNINILNFTSTLANTNASVTFSKDTYNEAEWNNTLAAQDDSFSTANIFENKKAGYIGTSMIAKIEGEKD